MIIDYPVNEYQTQLTEELLSQYPEEVIEQLEDCIQSIPFIQFLISPSRPTIDKCPHDDQGRVIVNITHPHIIRDMDYFRQPALHFMKHGRYTFLQPNSNPHSEYRKFWEEEKRRIREGYVRQSDGEWVTGFCYWFLNYSPMMVNLIKEGSKKADRVESFPFMFEGIYLRFHYLYQARENGRHAIELAKRGCAKSYTLSSIMSHNLILGENNISKRRVTTVLTAYQKEYLKADKDGTLSKFEPAIQFSFQNTPFPRLLLKDSSDSMSWIMGYEDEFGMKKGSRNQVMAVSAKDDSGKLRGKRGWILFEEMGSFKGLLSLYDVTRKSVEDGNYTFATMYLVGTAAEKESDFSAAKTLLYNTNGYNIYTLENVYDKVNSGSKTFGFFFPAYLNRAGCYNKDGVSDVIKALLEILMFRYTLKYNSNDPTSLLRAIAEDPITPAEAIIKVKAAYFPVTQLTERASELDSDPNAYSDIYVGDLVYKEDKVVYVPTNDIPIRKYGVSNDTSGALEIFQMPKKDSSGKVYPNRYIIGHDPVDNDQADSNSLSSTIVFDLYTDSIVAEFTGRKQFADDNFEMVRKLCLFYNARCMYESNKKGLYSYMASKNALSLLADTPEYLKEKNLIKYSTAGNNSKGVNASAPINNFANDLIRRWLLSEQPTFIKDAEGNMRETMTPKLYSIKGRALLDELISFNPELNVDRIRALGMVMIYREQYMILYQGNIKENKPEVIEKGYQGNDDFFTRNYKENKNAYYSSYSQ